MLICFCIQIFNDLIRKSLLFSPTKHMSLCFRHRHFSAPCASTTACGFRSFHLLQFSLPEPLSACRCFHCIAHILHGFIDIVDRNRVRALGRRTNIRFLLFRRSFPSLFRSATLPDCCFRNIGQCAVSGVKIESQIIEHK